MTTTARSSRGSSFPANSAVERVFRHFAQTIVPLWQGRGFNAAMRLPYESVLQDSVPLPVRYRAMACARQLFVFSELGDRPHADRLFAALIDYFRDPVHGGFFYSVDAAGQPRELEKDLYTHAFVIFACAAYMGRFQVAAARAVIDETVEVIGTRFTLDPATHLSHAVMSREFDTIFLTVRQNPLMHLTEAYLLARQTSGDECFDGLLDTLLNAVARAFVNPANACIMELPESCTDNWIEPGHQFEWFYLSQSSRHRAFARSGLDARLLEAFDFAQRHGVDILNGGVASTLDVRGHVLDGTQRIWAQTEYLRALACHPQPGQRAQVDVQLARFHARFLHPDGWHECLAPNGTVTRNDMPSTTPYHLLSSYTALR